jgi:hypothetical protein
MRNHGVVRCTKQWLAECVGLPGHIVQDVVQDCDADIIELHIIGSKMPEVDEGMPAHAVTINPDGTIYDGSCIHGISDEESLFRRKLLEMELERKAEEPLPTYRFKFTLRNSKTGEETRVYGSQAEPKTQPIGKDIVAKLAELTPTKLEYSEYTNCFYVHTNAEIGGDSFLCGITEHRATKEEAYEAFAQRITNLPQGKHLVIDAMKDSRKHYTWNGSEFVQIDEVTRKDVTP